MLNYDYPLELSEQIMNAPETQHKYSVTFLLTSLGKLVINQTVNTKMFCENTVKLLPNKETESAK